MTLYKVSAAWHNGDIAVEPGGVYELTADEAGQIETDCPGAVTALTEAQESAIREATAKFGAGSVQFRPPADNHEHRRPDGVNRNDMPRRPGGGAMSTVTDPALVRH